MLTFRGVAASGGEVRRRYAGIFGDGRRREGGSAAGHGKLAARDRVCSVFCNC